MYIGNRKTAQEGAEAPTTAYTSNQLNQYVSMTEGANPPFAPTYDADGNQTKLQTVTGEWTVAYNALNQAVSFAQGSKRVECIYDYLNRRVEKAVYEGETLMSKKRYLYNGYLQIAELDATNATEAITRGSNPRRPAQDLPVGSVGTDCDARSDHESLR